MAGFTSCRAQELEMVIGPQLSLTFHDSFITLDSDTDSPAPLELEGFFD